MKRTKNFSRESNNTFPTIKEMENAICFFGDCAHVEYHQDTHEFEATELVPYPTRDSGGGIDSVEFEEVIRHFSFLTAYQIWRDYDSFLRELPTNTPAPVPTHLDSNWEDDDLPF